MWPIASALIVSFALTGIARADDDVPRSKTINGLSAKDFDIVTPPKGVLSPADQQAYWNLHLTSKVCLEYRPSYGKPYTLNLRMQPAAKFLAAPQSPFPAPSRVASCVPMGPQTMRLQEPVVSETPPEPPKRLSAALVDEYAHHYGHHDDEVNVDNAGYWFASHLALHRAFPDGPEGRMLIDTLAKWARVRSYMGSIQVGGDKGPVIFAQATEIATMLNAYADLAPEMTADERTLIGPWLNAIMIKIAGNTDDFPTQNHEAGWGLMTAIWGLATGDREAVQHAIERYKLAIHNMRPDGSFAQDSSRGGSGLSYNNLITGDLVLTAALFKTSLDIDLFDYAVDDRSIHDAVRYVLASARDPVAYNKRYALPCPQASKGAVDQPLRDFGLGDTFSLSTYLPAYAILNPSQPASSQILEQYGRPLELAIFHQTLGAPPLCLFNIVPPGAARTAIRHPPVTIHTAELISYASGPQLGFHSLLQASIKGAPKGSDFVNFNIRGTYNPAEKNLFDLNFVINAPLGKVAPDALSQCSSHPQTKIYDDKQYRVILTFARDGKDWRPVDADCIAKAVPAEVGFMVRFISSRFGDLAKDLVASGEIDVIKNDNLRAWIKDVGDGKIAVRRQ